MPLFYVPCFLSFSLISFNLLFLHILFNKKLMDVTFRIEWAVERVSRTHAESRDLFLNGETHSTNSLWSYLHVMSPSELYMYQLSYFLFLFIRNGHLIFLKFCNAHSKFFRNILSPFSPDLTRAGQRFVSCASRIWVLFLFSIFFNGFLDVRFKSDNHLLDLIDSQRKPILQRNAPKVKPPICFHVIFDWSSKRREFCP